MLPLLIAIGIGLLLLLYLAFHVAAQVLIIVGSITALLFMIWLISLTPYWPKRP